MNTQEIINNLRVMSAALEKVANKPENYNTDRAFYLEQTSWQMHKMCNDILDVEYLFGMAR